MIYACPHYADPFVELLFESREEAEVYAKTYERIVKKKMKIEKRDENDCEE